MAWGDDENYAFETGSDALAHLKSFGNQPIGEWFKRWFQSPSMAAKAEAGAAPQMQMGLGEGTANAPTGGDDYFAYIASKQASGPNFNQGALTNTVEEGQPGRPLAESPQYPPTNAYHETYPTRREGPFSHGATSAPSRVASPNAKPQAPQPKSAPASPTPPMPPRAASPQAPQAPPRPGPAGNPASPLSFGGAPYNPQNTMLGLEGARNSTPPTARAVQAMQQMASKSLFGVSYDMLSPEQRVQVEQMVARMVQK